MLRRQRRRQSRSVCHACGGVFRRPAVYERNSHGIFENNKRCNDKIKNENGNRPTFNEYDNDDTTCVTRVLRLEGSLSSENDQEAAVGPAGMTLSVILPPLNKLGQDEEHVDQESLLTV